MAPNIPVWHGPYQFGGRGGHTGSTMYGPQHTGMAWAIPVSAWKMKWLGHTGAVWWGLYWYGPHHTVCKHSPNPSVWAGMAPNIPVWWGPYRFKNVTGMAQLVQWFIFQTEYGPHHTGMMGAILIRHPQRLHITSLLASAKGLCISQPSWSEPTGSLSYHHGSFLQ